MGTESYDWNDLEELEEKLRLRFEERFPGEVIWFGLEQQDENMILKGEVYSEHVRSQVVRQLAAFLVEHRIDDRLEVTGVFEPANEDWFLKGRAWSVEGNMELGHVLSEVSGQITAVDPVAESIQRHPSIESEGELSAGAECVVIIDLTVHESPGTEPITLAELPPGWESLTVEVHVSSTAFTAGGSGLIEVREEGTSVAARIPVRLRDGMVEGAPVDVTAVFNHNGRFCGMASAQLGKVVGTREEAAAATAPVAIAPHASSPTMTVTIIQRKDGVLDWSWVFGPGITGPASPAFGSSQLNDEPGSFAASLMETCPLMAPEDLKRQMGSIGEDIWAATPSEFRVAYDHVRSQHGPTFPIQFILTEFQVPWEMMRPTDGDHLYLTHPIARWPATRSDQPQMLPAGDRYTFVPQYLGPQALQGALDERNWLEQNLGARVATPSKDEFLKLLAADEGLPAVSLLHFAGHGGAAEHGRAAGILMEGDVEVFTLDVDARETKLGERDRSLVILNACETASVKPSLSWVQGWAPTLAKRGFGAVVTPLWRIEDEAAFHIVTSGLARMYHQGQTLGGSFTAARADAAQSSSSAYAFLAYGDVMARITGCP